MSERLYDDLAGYWPLLSPPSDYADEADLYLKILSLALGRAPRSLLELGSGGGHLAHNLPSDLQLTLVDRSAPMLAVSRELNPSRTHHEGDMRTLRLGRTYDAVLLHDAVMYLTTADDLRAAYATAHAHLAPGGLFLVLPDVTRESFEEGTIAGGGSGPDGRGARLLEWHWDPDPDDSTYRVDFAFLVRDPDGTVRCIHDPHTLGLFSRQEHADALRDAGFALVEPDPLLAVDCGELFLARRVSP